MGNSFFVHLLFKVADLFDLWKCVRLVRWHFIPRCVVEDEQGKTKGQGQCQWISDDLFPRCGDVSCFWIAVLQKKGDGREILSLLLASRNGWFVFGFGSFLGHD